MLAAPQTRFDPNTGKPIQARAQQTEAPQMRFDPNTGKPIQQKPVSPATQPKEQKKQPAEPKKQQKEPKKKGGSAKWIIIAAAAIAICAALVVVTFTVILPQMRYNKAKSLAAAGQYDEAIEAFVDMNGYKDSEKQIEACRNDKAYDAAVSLCDDGK